MSKLYVIFVLLIFPLQACESGSSGKRTLDSSSKPEFEKKKNSSSNSKKSKTKESSKNTDKDDSTLSFTEIKEIVDSMVSDLDKDDLCALEEDQHQKTFEDYLEEKEVEGEISEDDKESLEDYLSLKIKAEHTEKCESDEPSNSTDDATSSTNSDKDSEPLEEDTPEENPDPAPDANPDSNTKVVNGELTNGDQSYQYKGGTYFFDFLSTMPIDSNNKTYTVELTTSQFDPIIFIMQADRGKVLHTGKDVVMDGDQKKVSVTFLANSGQSVLISIETRNASQTGGYSVSIKEFE